MDDKTLHLDLFHPPTTDKTMASPFTPNHSDPAFVKKLRAALRRTGHLLPQTDREVESVLAEIHDETEKDDIKLSDPRELFRSGRSSARKSKMTLLNVKRETDDREREVTRSMALAAREGGQIAPEIRRRMNRDRAQAESQSTTGEAPSSDNPSSSEKEARENFGADDSPDERNGANN